MLMTLRPVSGPKRDREGDKRLAQHSVPFGWASMRIDFRKLNDHD